MFLLSVLCRFEMADAASLEANSLANVKEMPEVRTQRMSISPMLLALEVFPPSICEQIRNIARYRTSRLKMLASLESNVKSSHTSGQHSDDANIHQALTGTDIRLLYATLRN